MEQKQHSGFLERLLAPSSTRCTLALLILITLLNILCCITHDEDYYFFSLAFPYRCIQHLMTGEATPFATVFAILSASLFILGFVLLWHFSAKSNLCLLIAALLVTVDGLTLLTSLDFWSILDIAVHLLIMAELYGAYFFWRAKEGGEEFISVEPPEENS